MSRTVKASSLSFNSLDSCCNNRFGRNLFFVSPSTSSPRTREIRAKIQSEQKGRLIRLKNSVRVRCLSFTTNKTCSKKCPKVTIESSSARAFKTFLLSYVVLVVLRSVWSFFQLWALSEKSGKSEFMNGGCLQRRKYRGIGNHHNVVV